MMRLLTILMLAHRATDAGFVISGGAPRLLSGPKSVRITSEQVRLDMRDNDGVYDCTYVIQAPTATQIKIGFPDRGIGDEESRFMDSIDAAEAVDRKRPVYEGLEFFHLSVDGVDVSTALMSQSKASSLHVRQISLSKGTHRINANYHVRMGQANALSGAAIMTMRYEANYEGWAAPPMRSTVTVSFDSVLFDGDVQPFDQHKLDTPGAPENSQSWARFPAGTVVCSLKGATAMGKTLRFSFTNGLPTDFRIWLLGR
ncbi:MAG: hypothetical protein JSS72_06680 [Armatimonadetes bacterium]|nr:hypothetical protein [Armatimonadota bacterium]